MYTHYTCKWKWNVACTCIDRMMTTTMMMKKKSFSFLLNLTWENDPAHHKKNSSSLFHLGSYLLCWLIAFYFFPLRRHQSMLWEWRKIYSKMSAATVVIANANFYLNLNVVVVFPWHHHVPADERMKITKSEWVSAKKGLSWWKIQFILLSVNSRSRECIKFVLLKCIRFVRCSRI